MLPHRVLDLFTGIGGFSQGFERAGFKTVAFCEIDPDCRQVLSQHWPAVPIFEDITKLTGAQVREAVGNIDVITGGFPCQSLSSANTSGNTGIDKGQKSGLWWEMRRLISEIRPKFAVMENVPNFLSGDRGAWFGEFLSSLAEIGYNAEWDCISAAEVGLPHLRERVWIVAHPDGLGCVPGAIMEQIKLSEDAKERWQSKPLNISFDGFRRSYPEIPEHLRMDNGLPVGLDDIKARVRMLGNSLVPEIAYLIAKAIKGI